MTDPLSHDEYVLVILAHRLLEVIELKKQPPDDEWTEVTRDLTTIRNRLVHGLEAEDPGRARAIVHKLLGRPEILDYLELLERSSLGTSGAHHLRRQTSPARVAEILDRSS